MKITKNIYPLLGFTLNESNAIHLDLSIDNKEQDFVGIKSADLLADYLNKKLSNGKFIGYGGYAENRNLYDRFPLFNQFDVARNIHLGVDIWTDTDTPIYLPIDGYIFGHEVHDVEGGYGGVIIVEHAQNSTPFYTLYGHLSHDSIGMYDEGEFVSQGEVIGHLGNQLENGGWPPHLHFQVIQDLEGQQRDYPGVCTEQQAKHYLKNCPDPKRFYS